METTITLSQQREMLTNQIAQFKNEGKEIDLHNAKHDLAKLDEAKKTGLKYKHLDGKVYETFCWFYISKITGGKKWVHAYFYDGLLGIMEHRVYKKDCFK